MDVAPLLNASLAIKIHMGAVLVAIILILAIWRIRKGSKLHKVVGCVWVGAMALTALSSFWIQEIDQFMGFSFIHVISVFVLINCFRGVRYIRMGNVSAHKAAMKSMAFGGLGIAGAFTFLPGRIVHQMFLAP